MNGADEPAGVPGQERLGELLDELRRDPPTTRDAEHFDRRVLARARWQRPLHRSTRDAGALASSIGEALRLLLRRRVVGSAAEHRSDDEPPSGRPDREEPR
ncbi:hypothetical protein [Patulibacter defluvii]|uniref:hypothetical protein n=1 Tax=Patulibacter defluvii TaxID=3095358 RepID=UPI002A755690|nr:hypothetical protein [Patulibacter sp. DM4]